MIFKYDLLPDEEEYLRNELQSIIFLLKLSYMIILCKNTDFLNCFIDHISILKRI